MEALHNVSYSLLSGANAEDDGEGRSRSRSQSPSKKYYPPKRLSSPAKLSPSKHGGKRSKKAESGDEDREREHRLQAVTSSSSAGKNLE